MALNRWPSLCLLLLAFASSASAQDDRGSRPVEGVFPQGFDQVVYKGLVGKVLDAIPMDPSGRLQLQRTNAVVSNTLLGRSLSVLAGLANPLLLVGGFVWGVWSASNIKPAEAGVALADDSEQSGPGATAHEHTVALLDLSPVENEPASEMLEPILLSSISPGDAERVGHSRPHVIKIWPPQRSPLLQQ